MITIKSIPRIGSVSADVLTLQKALAAYAKANGIKAADPGNPDGIFGPKTKKAIQAVQKDIGTGGSGVLGPKTIAALGISVEAVSPVTAQKAVTQDLKGKASRHLHPSARLLIESKLFPNGEISECWKQKDIPACYIQVGEAMGELGWHETAGDNKGTQIGWIQATTRTDEDAKGGTGDAWCQDWAEMFVAIIEDFFGVESPVLASASTQEVWAKAGKVKGLRTTKPTAGAEAIGKHTKGDGGHAMPTLKINSDGTMVTCEGNTSIKSISNGDGSGIKKRDQKKNGDLVTLGWVMTYPDNKLPEDVQVAPKG